MVSWKDAAEIKLREDVRGQRFDGAEVELTLVDYTAVTLGGVKRRRGWFGELKQNSRGEFDVELRCFGRIRYRLSNREHEVFINLDNTRKGQACAIVPA